MLDSSALQGYLVCAVSIAAHNGELHNKAHEHLGSSFRQAFERLLNSIESLQATAQACRHGHPQLRSKHVIIIAHT